MEISAIAGATTVIVASIFSFLASGLGKAQVNPILWRVYAKNQP